MVTISNNKDNAFKNAVSSVIGVSKELFSDSSSSKFNSKFNGKLNTNSNDINFNFTKMKWYESLRTKLLIWFLVISFFPLVFFSNTMKNTMETYFKEAAERDLLYQANKIAIMIHEGKYLQVGNKIASLEMELTEKSIEEDFRIIVVDSQGVVIEDTNKIYTNKILLTPEIIIALQGENETTYYKDEAIIYACSYIGDVKEPKDGAVLLISSFAETDFLISEISQKWFMLIILISIAISILVFFASQIVIIPIKQILKNMNDIMEGQLHQRVQTKGHSEIAQLGEAFNEMTEKLEQIDTSRQEFVSNVSHELKTPLSSMKVLSESILTQENIPTEIYVEFLEDINSEIDRMTDIVNNLLSLVKLDYKQAEIIMKIEEIDLNKLTDEIIKRLTPIASQKDIELNCEHLKNIVVEVDETKVSLAISNIIENAIKYTRVGSVNVSVDADHQNAFIKVEDTGIGINDEEQGKIFTRFYRVDKTRDRETGGTGLGLSITHSAIILHKGSIRVSSEEGVGSTFIIRLPIKATPENNVI